MERTHQVPKTPALNCRLRINELSASSIVIKDKPVVTGLETEVTINKTVATRDRKVPAWKT